jgi:hypothetical protein
MMCEKGERKRWIGVVGVITYQYEELVDRICQCPSFDPGIQVYSPTP